MVSCIYLNMHFRKSQMIETELLDMTRDKDFLLLEAIEN